MAKRKSICGVDCEKCPNQQLCPGCAETDGRPFGGKCVAAECCRCGGKTAYETLKSELCAEFNALGIPGLPRVTELNELPGSYVNLEYPLGNGSSVKLLDDCRIYLGNQLPDELHPDSERCFGILCDETMLIVCTYGSMGAEPQLLCYRRRDIK